MLLAGCWVVASLVRCGRDKVRFAAGRPRPGPVPAAAPHPCCCPCDLTVESLSVAARTHRSSHATHGAAHCICMHGPRALCPRSTSTRPSRRGVVKGKPPRRCLSFTHQIRIVPVCRPRARPASIPARAHPRRGAGTCGPWIHSSTSTSTTRLPSYS